MIHNNLTISTHTYRLTELFFYIVRLHIISIISSKLSRCFLSDLYVLFIWRLAICNLTRTKKGKECSDEFRPDK